MLGQIDAIGVDEIQYAKGHKYLTSGYREAPEPFWEDFRDGDCAVNPKTISDQIFSADLVLVPLLKWQPVSGEPADSELLSDHYCTG